MTRMVQHNRWDSPLGELDIIEGEHVETTDGENSLHLVCRSTTVEKGDRLMWQDSSGEWREHVVDTVEVTRRNGVPVSILDCLDPIVELSQMMLTPSIIRPGSAFVITLNGLLSNTYAWTSNARWAIGMPFSSDTVPGEFELSATPITVRKALQELADYMGLEPYTRTDYGVSDAKIGYRRLVVPNKMGNQDAYWRFEYERNASSVSKKVNQHTPVARIYYYGEYENGERFGIAQASSNPTNLNYIQTSSSLSQYGLLDMNGEMMPTHEAILNTDYTVPNQLYAWAKRDFNAKQSLSVTYSADVEMLGGVDPRKNVRLGDSVQVVDRELPMRLSARIQGIRRDLVGDTMQLTIGNVTRKLSGAFLAQQRRADSISKRIDRILGQ